MLDKQLEQADPLSQQPGDVGTPEGVPPEPTDVGVTGTGDGNIGTGDVPQAGESEFSG